mmetsp:Transcript_15727/g.33974  ORF Transcript_15727/g.33974 Transcript_15727/m.33974 type:complete len:471 (+) Transcript_15727:69-1481(+)|eukprot:g12060.t1 g12060   contig6:1136472-1137965(-)
MRLTFATAIISISTIGLASPSYSFLIGGIRSSRQRHRVSRFSSNSPQRHIMSSTKISSSASPTHDDGIPCVAKEARSLNLFLTTPLIHSIPLSNLCAPHQVYLKLDLLQPSGSFKDRGMAHLCMTLKKVHTANRKQKQQLSPGGQDDGSGNTMKLISSSGGNAGLAVTTVARNIPDMEVSVIVPETTKPLVIEKLRSLGADVTVHGANWNLADDLARKLVKEHRDQDGDSALSGGAEYVSPYDNPLLWTGHSTVVDEIITQLIDTKHDVKVGAILASVGGGGLLCGILEGLERNYFGGSSVRSNVISGTKVVACETEGAASFAASFNAPSSEASETPGRKKGTTMVRLEGINSVATSLGALEVTPAVIHRSRRHQERGQIGGSGEDVLSYVCTDAEAVNACVQFSSHHRMLVEPACGAALAPLYSDRLRTKLLEELKSKGEESSAIVVEVCGGSGVNLDLLEGWKKQFAV